MPSQWLAKNIALQLVLAIGAFWTLISDLPVATGIAIAAAVVILGIALRKSVGVKLVWKAALLVLSLSGMSIALLLGSAMQHRAVCDDVHGNKVCSPGIYAPLPYDNPRRPMYNSAR
ncbi:hypothetical protein D6201_10115 [Aurantiacibacter aquimixticola]|uniref:Uncharacterized protein n=1 Tax=Aurantiacibacter aquimixticola TaxID=1958945 RepID=A0A419RV48_9SPHN|nr:hypothetical protein D6201_10115 [Aurantiacibacter aquimixticola]